MLSPIAAKLIVKHFDSVDDSISRKLFRKRPWQEPALNSLFCDLLDEDSQSDEGVAYTVDQLNRDLLHAAEPLFVSLNIETHQYPAHVERYVTQSDIGLIVSHQNQFEPAASWERGWLLQAKRMMPKALDPLLYTERSAFDSFDVKQHRRMVDLQDKLKIDFLRYLLYTPRPRYLQPELRSKLNYQRMKSLATDIFDFTFGLQLHEDLLAVESTIAAGVYVASIDPFPYDLAELHARIFREVHPFSWFILEHFASRHPFVGDEIGEPPWAGARIAPIIRALIQGDHSTVHGVLREQGVDQEVTTFPAHTIHIGVTTGSDLPRISNSKG